MKKFYLFLISVLFALSFQSCTYNEMVSKQESVESAWGNVENQYQRRADLIPNLVSTVKGYAAHEEGTLTAVMDARSKATQVTINADNLDEKTIAKYQHVQGELSSSLGRLLAVAENYPELKANQNFLELQAQLEGTENRIAVERRNYNNAVKSYNSFIRQFPMVIYSGWFGFEKKPYFETDEQSKQAPKVEF